jgi:CRP-like cAMP-binding protein
VINKLPNVLNSAELINFRRDEVIISEGEFARGIYFILSGEVVASKDVKI